MLLELVPSGCTPIPWGARWLSGRVSDSGARGPGSGVRDLPPPCCVLEQDTLLPESTGYLPRKRWLRPDMTEKLLTGTLSLNTTNHTLGLFSNDDPGLTLIIFMTGSNLFLMLLYGWQLIEHWVLMYFQVWSNSAYPQHSGERYRTNGPLVTLATDFP